MSKRRRKPTVRPTSAVQVPQPKTPEVKVPEAKAPMTPPWWFPLAPPALNFANTILQWWLTHGHR